MTQVGVRFLKDSAIITISEHLKAGEAESLLMWVKEFKDPSVKVIFFDFTACKVMEIGVYPLMGRIKIELSRQGLPFYSVNLSDKVFSRLFADGVVGLFSVKRGQFLFEGASISHSAESESSVAATIHSPESMNLLANELVHSLKSTNIDAELETPFPKAEQLFSGVGVMGMLPVSSPTLRGLVRVSVQDDFIFAFNREMFGQEDREITDEGVEMIEEITSVFFVFFRRVMQGRGIEVTNATPSMLTGTPSSYSQNESTSTMVVPCKTPYGKVYLEIVLAT